MRSEQTSGKRDSVIKYFFEKHLTDAQRTSYDSINIDDVPHFRYRNKLCVCTNW